MAFLCLHGNYGEDGSIQGLLKWLNIPYTGSGILPSAVGMNKAVQKKWMQQAGFACKPSFVIPRSQWLAAEKDTNWLHKVSREIGWPCVIRPANQGSSIGVGILNEENELAFDSAVDKAFFIRFITWDDWMPLDNTGRVAYIQQLTDIREGLGLPLRIQDTVFYQAETLMHYLNDHFAHNDEGLWLAACDGESHVLVEGFIKGKEFSCIVIKNDKGETVALPPTEIVKGGEVFDYRSKYLAGLSRKITPIDLPESQLNAVRHACARLYDYFEFNTYARIDGFIEPDGQIFLNDPNTTSGMLPSSFFFHQAAEIGLNPSQFLTYIIYSSLLERVAHESKNDRATDLLNVLDNQLEASTSVSDSKKRIAVILGGYSSERHISVESGRNVFEKLSASEKYTPVPVFLTGDVSGYQLYKIPINLLLKDNADDIAHKIKNYSSHPVIAAIRAQCAGITARFADVNYVFEPEQIALEQLPEIADEVFIALHGRPGEDGTIQAELEKIGLPYNGSSPQSSQITIDKFKTLETLRAHGFITARQHIALKADWENNPETFYNDLETHYTYPFICKPVDDGCSSAVKKIATRAEMAAYFEIAFRPEGHSIPAEPAHVLGLKYREEFPAKARILVETLIEKGHAAHFLEITGGMLTHRQDDGTILYEVFEPSETLAGRDVLSLEEKFLAGEGQNITPARFATSAAEQDRMSKGVRETLLKAARILDIEGYCRIDAFVRIYADGQFETIIIEVNSLPGMTPATVIYHQAALNGYKPIDFIDRIMVYAEKVQPYKTGRI